MKKLLPLILILFVTPSLCFSGWDGNKLLRYCKYKDDGSVSYYQEHAYCGGYIWGAADTLGDMFIICIDGITYGRLRKVVKKYLTNNPELLHHNADILVKNALVKAFPCK